MTSTLNKVTLIGNLGQDPEVRYTTAGTAIAKLSVATSTRRKNKRSGDWEDETQWHRVTVIGDRAEWVREQLQKGRTVYIEGSIRYGSFENQQGSRIPTVEILASLIEGFGPKKIQGAEQEPGAAQPSADAEGGQQSPKEGGDPWLDEYDQA